MDNEIKTLNTTCKAFIDSDYSSKRVSLQKEILWQFKSFPLNQMNQLEKKSQFLICSWTYHFLTHTSSKNLDDKILTSHSEISNFFVDDNLNLSEFIWIMQEFQSYLNIYKNFEDKTLSNITKYLKDPFVREDFLARLKHQEITAFERYQNTRHLSNFAPPYQNNLKEWCKFHHQMLNLKKIDELQDIANRLKSMWYFFCIPIPIYWNGLKKATAIETFIKQINDPQNFDFDEPNNTIAQKIKKTLTASRWVWKFLDEDQRESGRPNMGHS